jgi:hypothetical protein
MLFIAIVLVYCSSQSKPLNFNRMAENDQNTRHCSHLNFPLKIQRSPSHGNGLKFSALQIHRDILQILNILLHTNYSKRNRSSCHGGNLCATSQTQKTSSPTGGPPATQMAQLEGPCSNPALQQLDRRPEETMAEQRKGKPTEVTTVHQQNSSSPFYLVNIVHAYFTIISSHLISRLQVVVSHPIPD